MELIPRATIRIIKSQLKFRKFCDTWLGVARFRKSAMRISGLENDEL
jgi:hypothetical protein